MVLVTGDSNARLDADNEALLGGYACPPSEFQILSSVENSEGPYFVVGISSSAPPEIKRTSYVLLAAPKFQGHQTASFCKYLFGGG